MSLVDIIQFKANSISADVCINKIICGDCLSVMRAMPDQCVDLIITSPPYNLLNSTGNGLSKSTTCGKWKNAQIKNGYQDFNDNMPYPEYIEWQKACVKEMFRLVKNDGAVFYNNKNRIQNGLLQDRSEIVRDLPLRQIITWKRKGGINFNAGYFLPTTEQLYLLCRKPFKLVKGANKWTDVWEIQQERNNPHPAPFPEELIDRIIGSCNAKVVLDPFAGSGTTAVCAKKAGRDFILIEKSKAYCEMAQKRINGDQSWQNI